MPYLDTIAGSPTRRNCNYPKIVAWSAANSGLAMPSLLDETANGFTGIATLKPDDNAIVIGSAGNFGNAWRPSRQSKLGMLEFASLGNAADTSVWMLGAYSFPYYTTPQGGVPAYLKWKLLAQLNFTLTLGTKNDASQTADPWQGLQTFASAALRYASVYTASYDGFGSNSVNTSGFGGNNQSGRIILDYSFASLFVLINTTKAANGALDMFGVTEEND